MVFVISSKHFATLSCLWVDGNDSADIFNCYFIMSTKTEKKQEEPKGCKTEQKGCKNEAHNNECKPSGGCKSGEKKH